MKLLVGAPTLRDCSTALTPSAAPSRSIQTPPAPGRQIQGHGPPATHSGGLRGTQAAPPSPEFRHRDLALRQRADRSGAHS